MSSALDPETLVYGFVVASDPQIAPDATRVVYGLGSFEPATREPRDEVWICEIAGSNARRLTPVGQRCEGARWAPDSARVAYVVHGEQCSAIAVMPVDEPERAVELTRNQHRFGDLAWSPDGTMIAATALVDGADKAAFARVTRRLDYKEDGRGYLGDTRKQVFLISAADGGCRQLTFDNQDHDAPTWSRDGRMLAMGSPRPDERTQLIVIDLPSNERRAMSPPDAWVQHWAWSPDGRWIIYAGDPGHSMQPDYYIADVMTGESHPVTDDPGFAPTSPPAPPVWLSGDRVLLEATSNADSELLMLATQSGGLEVIDRVAARYTSMSADLSGRYIVQAESSPTSTGELSVYDHEAGARATITSYNRALLTVRPPAQCERFEVSSDGGPIDTWLLKPPDFDPGKRYPVILDVHGGPTSLYGSNFMALQQCLATNGFLVVYANPRGSSSYGRAFARANVRDWGGGDYRDLMAVVDAVLERDYADPERTGIYGYSYGGYMTAWTITQTQRFKAAVCGAPLFDLESYWGTSDLGHRGIEKYAGGSPREQSEWYAAHSPSTFAHQTRTPTLIIHGEDDHRCPVGQGEQMFVALRLAGCEAEFARYPSSSHLFIFNGSPEARLDYLARVLAWFTDHLGGPA